MSISDAPMRADRRTPRPLPLALLGGGVVLTVLALVALRWFTVVGPGVPSTDPRLGGMLVLPPSKNAGRAHGHIAWVLVLVTVVAALGTLLPRPRLALACRAGAPALAAASLLWVLGRVFLIVWITAVSDLGGPWSASPAAGLFVEVAGLVLLAVGAALGPRPTDLALPTAATVEVPPTS